MSEVLRLEYMENKRQELYQFEEVVKSDDIKNSLFTFLGLGTLEIFVRGRACPEYSDKVYKSFAETLSGILSFSLNPEDNDNFTAVQSLARIIYFEFDRRQVGEWLHENYMKNSFENAPWRLTQVFKRLCLNHIKSVVIKKEIEENNMKPDTIKSVLNIFSNTFKVCVKVYKNNGHETFVNIQPGQYPIIYLLEEPSSEFCLLRHRAQLAVDRAPAEVQNLFIDSLTYSESTSISFVLPHIPENLNLPKPQNLDQSKSQDSPILPVPVQDQLPINKLPEVNKAPQNLNFIESNKKELQESNFGPGKNAEVQKVVSPIKNIVNVNVNIRPPGENKPQEVPKFAEDNKKGAQDSNVSLFRGADVKKVPSPNIPRPPMAANNFAGDLKPSDFPSSGPEKQESDKKGVQDMYNRFIKVPENQNSGNFVNPNSNQPGPAIVNLDRNKFLSPQPVLPNNIGPVKVPSNNVPVMNKEILIDKSVITGNPMNIVGPVKINPSPFPNLNIADDRNSVFPSVSKAPNIKPDAFNPNRGTVGANPQLPFSVQKPEIIEPPGKIPVFQGQNNPVIAQAQLMPDKNKNSGNPFSSNFGKPIEPPVKKDVNIKPPLSDLPVQPDLVPKQNAIQQLYQPFINNGTDKYQFIPKKENSSNQDSNMVSPEVLKISSEEPKKVQNQAIIPQLPPKPIEINQEPNRIFDPVKNPEQNTPKLPEFYKNFISANPAEQKPPVFVNNNTVQNMPPNLPQIQNKPVTNQMPFSPITQTHPLHANPHNQPEPKKPIQPFPSNFNPNPSVPVIQNEEKMKFSAPEINPNIQFDKKSPIGSPFIPPNPNLSQAKNDNKRNEESSNAPNIIFDPSKQTFSNQNTGFLAPTGQELKQNIPNAPPNNQFPFPNINVKFEHPVFKQPPNIEAHQNKPVNPADSEISYNLPSSNPNKAENPPQEKKFVQNMPEIPTNRVESHSQKFQMSPSERSFYEETIQILSDALQAANSKSPQLLISLENQCKKFPYLRNLKSISNLIASKPLANSKKCLVCKLNKEFEDFAIVSCGDVNNCVVCNICRIENMKNGCQICARAYSDYEMETLEVTKLTI